MTLNFPGGIGRGKLIVPQPVDNAPGNNNNNLNGPVFGSSSAGNEGGGFMSGGRQAGGFGGGQSSGFGGGGQSARFGDGNQSGGFGGSSGGGGGFGGQSNGFGDSNQSSFGGGGNRFGGSGSGGDRKCNACGEPGHIARSCPSRGGIGGGRGGGSCHKCGQPGHRSAECTDQAGGSGGGFGSSNGAGGGYDGFGKSGRGEESGGFGSGGGRGGFGGSSGGGGGGFGSSAGFGAASDGDNGFKSGGGGGGFGRGGFGGGGGNTSGSGGGRACHSCGQEGHISRECPNRQGGGAGDNKCRRCHEEGHMARNCPTAPPSSDGCRRCHATDHHVSECPQPMKCFNCNGEGHQSKDCPNPRASTNEDGTERKPAQTYQPKELTDEDVSHIERIHSGINFERYDQIHVQVTGIQDSTQIETFEDAGLTETVLENLRKTRWKKWTPIQKRAIPLIMAGHDLMACAQTGSGKTAAYLLPVISCMMKRGECDTRSSTVQEPITLIVAPTRELVKQIFREARYFVLGTSIRVCSLYGGTAVRYTEEQIQKGCHILIATPGRLGHFIKEGRIGLSKCRYIILDEADHMLDMGFEPEIRRMVDNPTLPVKADRQTLLFSATFPEAIQTLAQDYLRNKFAFIAVGIVGGANSDITQQFEEVDQYSKKDRLIELLREDLKNWNANESGIYARKTLVFVERKRVADFTATLLSQLDFKATSIHGDREQKQREQALEDFTIGHCSVLIATAVAARGLDIVGVDHVINYDLPSSIDDYVHRIGRTGRVGNPGRASSFFDKSVDIPLASQLIKILSDAQQVVPDWLQAYGSNVNSYGDDGRGMFGGTDIRQTNGGWASNGASNSFSGAANDDSAGKWY